MRICHICQTETDDVCPTCMAAFPNRRDATTMTGDERAAELAVWGDVLEIPFALTHQRIEELVGRPVWTHEMAGYERFNLLIEESRSWIHPSLQEVIGLAKADIVVVHP